MNMNTSLGQGGASPPLKQHRTLKKKKKIRVRFLRGAPFVPRFFPRSGSALLQRPHWQKRGGRRSAVSASAEPGTCARAFPAFLPGCPVVPGVAGSALPEGVGLDPPSPWRGGGGGLPAPRGPPPRGSVSGCSFYTRAALPKKL